jgi:MFS transporter, DHA1 family, inner membrane transport protein
MLVVVALSVSLFCLVTVESLPVGLLPVIAGDLRVSLPTAGLLVTGYGLTVAATSVPLTQLVRRIPRRFLLSGLLAVFMVATLAGAIAPNYPVLLAARVSIALTHAIFWSVVAATAAGLFPPERRGRVVGGLFTGVSLATVAGVPAGTWLGQATNWRVPFLVMAGFSLLALVPVAAFLPTSRPAESHAAAGSAPSARRFWMLMLTTALAVTGTFTAYTYIAAYLTDGAGFARASVGPLLSVAGVAGILGTNIAGRFVDRHARTTMGICVALIATTLLGLTVLHAVAWAVVGLLALLGFATAGNTTSLQSRVLTVAPGSTDIASATASATFNVGIAAGAYFGGILLASHGIRNVTVVGGLLTAAALAVLLIEPLVDRGKRVAPDTVASQVAAG